MTLNIKITANGINTNNLHDVEPDINEIKYCENILKNITEKKIFNKKHSSYGYKHLLERFYTTGYISNGALIKAAQNLGFSISANGLNAYFKFSKKDLKTALLTYIISNHKTGLKSHELNLIYHQLKNIKKNRPQILSDIISKLKKQVSSVEAEDILQCAFNNNYTIKPHEDYLTHIDFNKYKIYSPK